LDRFVSFSGFDRLSFAGARNGDLPAVFALINVKFFTPMTSLVFQVTSSAVTLRGHSTRFDQSLPQLRIRN